MKVKLLFFETQVTPFWTKQKLEYTNISYLIFLYQLLIIKSISTDVLSFKSQFLDVYIIFCFSSFSGFIMVSASLFYQTMAVSIFRLLQDRSELKKKRKVFRYSNFCFQYVVQALFPCRKDDIIVYFSKI